MANVKYTDNEGFTWAVCVPNGTADEFFSWGVPIGPPDLTALNLTKEEWIALQAALVEKDLLTAPQLMGKRSILKEIFTDLDLPEHKLREIISLYQQVYYGRDG